MISSVPPIIMIPGMQCTGAMFRPLVAELAKILPGLQPRTHIVRESTLTAAVESLIERITEPVIIVGHSLGGTVAMAAARTAPGSVAGLALLCANPRAPRQDQLRSWRMQRARATDGSFETLVEETVALLVADGSTRSPQGLTVAAETCRAMAHEIGAQGLNRQLGIQLDRADERPGLQQFAGPVIAVAGSGDSLVSVQSVSEISAHARHGETYVLPETSHMAPLTSPVEVSSLLARWLTENFGNNPERSTRNETQKVSQ